MGKSSFMNEQTKQHGEDLSLFSSREEMVIPSSGIDVHLYFYWSSTPGPTVCFFPGEIKNGHNYNFLAEKLLSKGLSLIVFSYKDSLLKAEQFSFPKIFEASLKAFDQVYNLLEEKNGNFSLALLGRSLGSVLALRLGIERFPLFSALILDSPILDSNKWLSWRGGKSLEEEIFHTEEFIKRWLKPLLIFQPQLDKITSLPEVERLLVFCPAKNKRLLIMPGYKREETIEKGGELYVETIAELLNRLANRLPKKKYR